MQELNQPVLYLSLFFKNNRNEYYERLSAVRTHGDWEGWLQFFLTGVAETAQQVVETTNDITEILEVDKKHIRTLKRASIRALKVHDLLSKEAIVNVKDVVEKLEMTDPTARAALNDLKELGIVHEISGKGKERLYLYSRLIELLEQGASPIAY